jgi:hypothetical protein
MGFIGMSPLDVAACCGVVGVHRPSRGKSVAQRSSSSGAKTISLRVSNYGSGCWRGCRAAFLLSSRNYYLKTMLLD